MASPPSPPPSPSVADIVGGQKEATGYTIKQQQAANMTNQATPVSNLTYTPFTDPTTGQIRYNASASYTPEQQALLNLTQAQGAVAGATGLGALSSMFPQYSQAPNFNQGAASLTAQAEAPVQAAYERFFTPERQQLAASLESRGIMPGSAAYQQQIDAQTQQQNLTEGAWLANIQPRMFEEGVTGYTTPLDTITRMFSMGQPTNLPGSFMNTPQVQAQAPNVNQAFQTNLGQQNFAYQQNVAANNNLNSLFGSGAMAMLPLLLA